MPCGSLAFFVCRDRPRFELLSAASSIENRSIRGFLNSITICKHFKLYRVEMGFGRCFLQEMVVASSGCNVTPHIIVLKAASFT